MTYTPELGQMAFGAAYGEFSTPSFVTAGIDALDALTMEHIYGAREVMGEYGSYPPDGVTGRGGGEHIFEGAPFAMRSYYWDCMCDLFTDTHDPDCKQDLPNFEHFQSGFEARWYKHSHRGETTNREITSKEWRAIQRECEDWILAQPPAFRVLVTGSRDWAPELYRSAQGKGDHPSYKRLRDDWVKIASEDKDTMIEAFRAARQKAGDARMVIVQGGASGADNLAWALGEIADNCEVETHRALWNRKGDTYNRAAGFERNARMVETGVDLCIGFFKRGAGNRGTKHCFDLAAKAGVETMEVWSA